MICIIEAMILEVETGKSSSRLCHFIILDFSSHVENGEHGPILTKVQEWGGFTEIAVIKASRSSH